MRKIWVVAFLLALSVSLWGAAPRATLAAYPVSWTVNSLDTVGCNSGDIGFTTTLSGYTGGTERFRTIVDAAGQRYMDEDAGTPNGGNGTYGWHLYDSSSGGPTTATFPLPPDQLITVHFMLIDGIGGPTLTEQVVMLSRCNGGSIVSGAGSDMVAIPDTAVVGAFVATTPIYYAPQSDAVTTTVMVVGKTAWVYGQDASHQYYKVMLAGKFFWVPVSTMGPNYDNVWNGKPLPTDVVS